MPPRITSSMLGCVAAVMAMVSPSHPSPAVIHRTSISLMGGVDWVVLATGPPVRRASRGSGAGSIFLLKVDLGKRGNVLILAGFSSRYGRIQEIRAAVK